MSTSLGKIDVEVLWKVDLPTMFLNVHCVLVGATSHKGVLFNKSLNETLNKEAELTLHTPPHLRRIDQHSRHPVLMHLHIICRACLPYRRLLVAWENHCHMKSEQ
jgi:hypothetical protein